MTEHTLFFSAALRFRKKEESDKFALTFNFRKVIWAFAIKKGGTFENSTFYPKKIGTD